MGLTFKPIFNPKVTDSGTAADPQQRSSSFRCNFTIFDVNDKEPVITGLEDKIVINEVSVA